MEPQPKISFIVCTRNRAHILGDCLESLLKQDVEPSCFEVVVIDDGSSDGTAELVERLAAGEGSPRLPEMRCVSQPHGGLNRARNNGAEQARGQVVVFLDDDELAPTDYLAKVLAAFDEDPGLDGVGGPTRDFGGALPTCPECALGDVDVGGEGRRVTERLLGGNMALRVECFERVGVFDPDLSGRGDDGEWFRREAARELRFIQDPELWVWHRRDHFNLRDLVQHAFIQGRATPVFLAKTGVDYRPSFFRVGRYLAHAVRRRCARGLVLATRELGCLAEMARLKVTGRKALSSS